MGYGFSVRMDVDDHDVIFDGHGGRSSIEFVEIILEVMEVFFLL